MHIVGITGSLRKASTNTGILRAMRQKIPAPHTMEIIVPDLPLFNKDVEVHSPHARVARAGQSSACQTKFPFKVSKRESGTENTSNGEGGLSNLVFERRGAGH